MIKTTAQRENLVNETFPVGNLKSNQQLAFILAASFN